MPVWLAVALVVSGCQVTIPDGVYGCATNADCPPTMYCGPGFTCHAGQQPIVPFPGFGGRPGAPVNGASGSSGEASEATAAGHSGGANNPKPPIGRSSAAAPSSAPTAGASSPTQNTIPSSPVATAGEPCQQREAHACVAEGSRDRLRCDGTTWVAAGSCPDGPGVRCDTRAGDTTALCLYSNGSCTSALAGQMVCAGPQVHTCKGGSETSALTLECSGDTPDCVGSMCACRTRCDGQCRSLLWDPKNCGACNNDCHDGGCESGICQNTIVTRDALIVGSDMAVDDKSVYWLTFDGMSLMSAPIGGVGAAAKLLAAIGVRAEYSGFLSDGSYVYTLDSSSGTLTKYPVAGGDGIVLVSNLGYAADLVADDTFLYWHSGSTFDKPDIFKLPKSGGTPTQVGSDVRPSELISNRDYLYYYSENSPAMNRISKSGGDPTRFPVQQTTFHLGVAGDYLYYTTGEGFRRMPIAGGDEVTLFDDSANSLHQFVLDGESAVYWIEGISKVVRHRLEVGAPPTSAYSEPTGQPIEFVLDAKSMYIGSAYHIVRLPKPLD
jgi:hypothetical protein